MDFLDKDKTAKALNFEEFNKIKYKTINYLVINTKDDTVDEIFNVVKSTIDELSLEIFLVSNIICSFIIVLTDIEIKRLENDLKEMIYKTGDGIRIIYGSVSGGLANLGNDDYQIYGPIIPKFNEKINFLLKLNFGEMKSI